MDNYDLKNRFTYHPPKDDQAIRYGMIKVKALDFADWIDVTAPDSREKSLAIIKLEEAVFWCNAAIARNE